MEDKAEIEKLIEQEKEQLRHFLRLAKRLSLSEEEIEEQTNFYLDKISELIKKLL